MKRPEQKRKRGGNFTAKRLSKRVARRQDPPSPLSGQLASIPPGGAPSHNPRAEATQLSGQRATKPDQSAPPGRANGKRPGKKEEEDEVTGAPVGENAGGGEDDNGGGGGGARSPAAAGGPPPAL